MSEVRLPAERRTEFGKGGARRTRRAGKIPAVLYGHGVDPQHLSLPAREFSNAVRHGGANVLLTLEVDGDDSLAIPKAIQRHAVKGTYDHVDLLAVRRGEKISVQIPIIVVGEVVSGGLMQQEAGGVSVLVDATNIPSEFSIDISDMEIGDQKTVADLDLPAGVESETDAETLVVLISEAPSAEALEAEMEEAAAELGIEQDQPESQTEAAEGESSEGDSTESGDSE